MKINAPNKINKQNLIKQFIAWTAVCIIAEDRIFFVLKYFLFIISAQKVTIFKTDHSEANSTYTVLLFATS